MSPTLSLIITVITSAAVGSLVTAVVQTFGGWRERRARRQELLLARAIDLASARTERMLRWAERTGGTVDVRDDVFLAEGYFQWLSHLMDHGKLPSEAHEIEAKSQAQLDALDAQEARRPGKGR
jgi:hypothetical protein